MNARLAALVVVFLPALPSNAQSKLSQLRGSAEPLSGLSAFLERYIGNCGEKVIDGECRSSATAFRRKVDGKRFYLVISEETASKLLAIVSRGGDRAQYTFQITPFFGSGGYALTHGSPKKTDVHGNPQLPLLLANSTETAGSDVAQLQRLLNTRQVQLQLIFVPQGLWTLPKKGGGKIEGVKAMMEAIQVTNLRTGDVLATWPST